MSESQTSNRGNEILPEQLHVILHEWSQLIGSLANLIKENVEGLLPAVFGLAGLAQKTTEAKVGASSSAREAGASLRDRAASLQSVLAPLASAADDAKSLHAQWETIREEAAALAQKHAGDTELSGFFQRFAAGSGSSIDRLDHLVDAAEAVQSTGLGALQELEQSLDQVDSLLHHDTAELEAAAARVKQFVESSRAAIDQLIVKLQFQDRTDQILQHLLADFESLRSALAEVGDQPFDLEAWNENRKQRFTTVEERSAGSAISTDPGDVELF
ncbi:hypothetical protein [Pseudomarimonas arenosa]|uniref:Chemotaxis protein CheZ n=1 Tax=Pseudomarimonas arenosa TaxID=2774145 RepID=A0AAW3ZKB5_9GAMM|nr:hypothetical protein [Pseudomarimonas arenosa]MBD8526193.1 hypothetical protein [Pseudomarimonas arenosa]